MDITETNPSSSPEQFLKLPEEEEDRCRRYARARFYLNLADFLVPVSVLAGLTFSGAAERLLQWCALPEFGGVMWPAHALFLLLVGVVVRVSSLPIHFLSESWVDRRFGLSREGFGSWFWEWLCRSAVFGVAILALLFPAMELLRWWPVVAILSCPVFLLLRPLFLDWVYEPLMRCFYPVHFLRYETFSLPGVGRVTLPVHQVQVSHKTSRANAAIRLRGKNTAIYVTDTLIDEFTDGEERVVMAHEFGHLYDHVHLEARTPEGVAQAHRKLKLGSVRLLAGMVSLCLLWLLSPALGLTGVDDLRGFPLLAAMTLVLATAFTPFLCAEARHDEHDADEVALAITGDVENYLSVMRKLRRMNLEASTSGPLAHLLFETHPSYVERARLALSYRRRKSRRRKSPHWRGWRNVQRHGRR